MSLDRPWNNIGLQVVRVAVGDLPCLLLQPVGWAFFKSDALSPENFKL